VSVEQWSVVDIELTGAPASDTSVELRATFTHAETSVAVQGFWDGGSRYVVRFSPDAAGDWTYVTSSSDPLLDGVTGELRVVPPTAGNDGGVRVAGTFHFAYDSGRPYRPVGTTVYNWVHQPETLYVETVEAVADAGFNKLRFLVFPQGGGHVAFVPPLFPFERDDTGRWLVDRPIPQFFQKIDRAVADLLERGIEADVIIFHPYDQGEYGLDAMSPDDDDAYVRYLIARLGAYRNVWWSLANEYDQLKRPEERWDRVFQTIESSDPYGRLRSIHNWIDLYDYNKPWVTHASLQNGFAVAEFGRAGLYRDAYRKPIVMDEIKYEGDIPERWGHLSAQDLVHRFWIATVSGTYATHGESYLFDDGSLHIVIGGRFRGTSPARLAFLKGILEDVDGEGLEPIDKWDDDTSTVGIPRQLYIQYLGRTSPAQWDFELPQGVLGERLEVGDRFRVDIVDTWNMTVTPTGETYELTDVQRNLARADGVSISLPEGEALAIRVTRV
jgi:hypothetical protein